MTAGAVVVVMTTGDVVVVIVGLVLVTAWSLYTWLRRSQVITEPLTDVALSETIWPGS
jgi:hypothetical protein